MAKSVRRYSSAACATATRPETAARVRGNAKATAAARSTYTGAARSCRTPSRPPPAGGRCRRRQSRSSGSAARLPQSRCVSRERSTASAVSLDAAGARTGQMDSKQQRTRTQKGDRGGAGQGRGGRARGRHALPGTRMWSNAMATLSRSLPTVLRPMSVRVTPSTTSPSAQAGATGARESRCGAHSSSTHCAESPRRRRAARRAGRPP